MDYKNVFSKAFDFKQLDGAFERLSFSVLRHHKDYFRHLLISQ